MTDRDIRDFVERIENGCTSMREITARLQAERDRGRDDVLAAQRQTHQAERQRDAARAVALTLATFAPHTDEHKQARATAVGYAGLKLPRGDASATVCGKRCDHGSECLAPAGHDPATRHETQHGCVFFDPAEPEVTP